MSTSFDLREVLLEAIPEITVIDVGASAIGNQAPFYQGLRTLGVARVIGFEPDAAACARLNQTAVPGDRFLPMAIGDGREGVFRSCRSPFTSSLLEPNFPLLDLFQNLGDLCRVLRRDPIQTHRLDDVAEITTADFLKIDVQGAELQVLEGGRRLLDRIVVVQTEVEFVPLYQGQPLFADIDAYLRSAGFLFHRFLGMAGRSFRPFLRDRNPNLALSQSLWADAIFVRDFTRLDDCAPSQLLKMAVILHAVYGSVDLAYTALVAFDRRCGTAHAPAYLGRFAR